MVEEVGRKERERKREKIGEKKQQTNKDSGETPVRSVLFVEYTTGGGLARKLRNVVERLKNIIGARIKIVERTGTPLARQISLTTLWDGMPCWRENCTTCKQEGELIYPCFRRNVVYENICLLCNPEASGKQGRMRERDNNNSIYVGESSRSLYERGQEHWDTFQRGEKDSQILKHHMLTHKGIGEPSFHLRPVKFHTTPLGRQVHEAVRIQRRGGELVLNSKGEYNRCEIARLTLGNEEGKEGMDAGEEQATQEKEV